MADDSFYAKINQLGRFLTREDERGYSFACALDQRLIPIINRELIALAKNKWNKKVSVLQAAASDVPLFQQLETLIAEQAPSCIIIYGLDVLIARKGFLQGLNFSRESLNGLALPILFWATDASLAIIGNTAADLFSQRRMATVYFDPKPELFAADPYLPSRFAENSIDKETYEQLQSRINLLKAQLGEVKKAQLSERRIAIDYALPLAKAYADLDLTEPANDLLQLYAPDWEMFATGDQMLEIASIAEKTHQYDLAERYLVELIEQEKKKNGDEVNESLISNALSGLGDLFMLLGRFEDARKYFEEDLLLSERLAKSNPQSEQLQRDLGIGIAKLADLEKSLGLIEQARARYEQFVEISERLAKSNPQSEQLQRDLGIGYYNYASVLIAAEENERANQYFHKSWEICVRLCNSNPNNWEHWEGLGITSSNLGKRATRKKDAARYFEEAGAAFEKAYSLSGLTRLQEAAEMLKKSKDAGK